MKKIITVSLLLFLANSGYAQEKVKAVQEAIKASCSKDVSKEDALRYVKDLFLSCTSNSTVKIDGCDVKCLKDNAGAVVGK